MDLGKALLAVGEGDRPASFEVFGEAIDPALVAAVLEQTGTASLRRRKLPAERAVWLIIGMSLFRDRSIASVVGHLGLVLPGMEGLSDAITSGGIVKARDRLGSKPMRMLFDATAEKWSLASADAHRWHDLSVFGIDGSTLRIADTAENETEFGRPGNSPDRGKAGYPQLRLVALMALRSHILAALSIGGWSKGELSLAEEIWPRIPDRSLTVLDRGFLSYAHLHDLSAGGKERHWLIRAKAGLKWTVVERISATDAIVEIATPQALKRKRKDIAPTMRVRAITYQRRGFRPQVLLTSLLDPVAYPATEIVGLYHERWELELGFDEIKTHTLLREESLRSRDPQRTLQELWGLAIAYNLTRLHMEQVAAEMGVAPVRISYRGSILLIRDIWRFAWFMAPGSIPSHLAALDQQTRLMLLPPRRERKSYPRAVKLKQSNYNRKR